MVCQVIVILIAWGYLCSLQTHNDGLWFQGDAPRHALNGLFWKDFLHRLPADPQAFSLSYFVRYPAINPVSYPPFFYWLEAGLFTLLGPSPYVAKGIVLSFALVEALYAREWLTRWVDPAAGYLAVVVLLLPGIVQWSNAIMLNVPACALSLAAMYHTRRWLADLDSWHFYVAACFSTLAVLTYFQAAVVVPIIVAWVVVTGRSRLLIAPRTLATAAVCGVILLPFFVVALKWARMHVELTAPAIDLFSESTSWLYYLKETQSMCGQAIPALRD